MDQKGELIVMGSGTSQGIPVIGCDCAVCRSADVKDKRTRSSVHLQLDGLHLQIDTGQPEIIQKVSSQLQIPLIVGGGIRSKTQLNTAFNAGADLVVIGTAFEENEEFLLELRF